MKRRNAEKNNFIDKLGIGILRRWTWIWMHPDKLMGDLLTGGAYGRFKKRTVHFMIR